MYGHAAISRRLGIFLTAAAVIALTAFALLHSQGHASADDVRAAQQSAAQQRAEEIYTQIHGDATQTAAGEFLVNYAVNHPLHVCMAAAGYQMHWSCLNGWLDGGRPPGSTVSRRR